MKEVKLKIRVDKNGKIHVKPEGTVGSECLELMKCIDSIKGMKCEETFMNDDSKKFDASICESQHISE